MSAVREARTIGVCLVSQDDGLAQDLGAVLDTLNNLLRGTGAGILSEAPKIDLDGLYRQVLFQAGRYLQAQADGAAPLSLELQCFSSIPAARQALGAPERQACTECVLLDARNDDPDVAGDPFLPLMSDWTDARLSPCSAMLLCQEECLGKWMCLLGGNRLIRVPHSQEMQRRADLLRLLVDHLEHAYFNRLLARTTQQTEEPVAVAQEVYRLMQNRWKDRWDFHFFTGSMVAGFIDSMQGLTRGTPVGCHTGCNEHSLAVSALAGWQLYGRAYVIAITSGMIDEARGTLANLKRAGAPGLIVCADSPETVWYAFQGTIDADNNGHRVIEARGLWHSFMRRPEDIAACLDGAFRALDEHPAPTFLFATQSVLESRAQIATAPPSHPVVSVSGPCALSDAQRQRLDIAVNVLNKSDARVLWQCGRLTPSERDRVTRLAGRAGIALADTIISPGGVVAYQDGRPVPNYLGTLSMYGFTRRIHAFLEDGTAEPGNAEIPWLFFLKSKVDQSATPYSEGRLKRNFQVAQVNRNAAHIAPFTRLSLDVSLDVFLDYLEARIQVEPEVLRRRQARLECLRSIEDMLPSDRIETMPMTPNYFFYRLGQLVSELIEDGYRYTGVYDVGRCGLSAVRNVPRTDAGFSGWYGRALMGDALMSLPYIALKNEHNVLAFVGDGARALVPNVEQRLAMCTAHGLASRQRNITVFYLTNGVLSMIQTYLDKRYALNGATQVNVPMFEHVEAQETRSGSVRVHRACIRRFCAATLREALTAPGRLNFFDVWLGHNSEGDGLSLVSETSWSRVAAERTV
ncbi:hypothetical protein [Thauera sp. Sel9]|uniref:hypothetical protein n=1 Tax=Thauera sp. Sel9 TaxID=2974299 RepID=UPI0021E19C16|nr:hypothetical protein [Thauera sp. Sel9]MCV2219018.1 hypothetical protein [Thauera sp. Sel9]